LATVATTSPSAAGAGARRIHSEPRWRPVAHYGTARLPAATRAWLTDDGSLTERLIGLGRGPFRVERLYQGWQVPLPSERALLDAPARQRALVREVALVLGDQPVVFARSVFPVDSLAGSLRHLRRLTNRSLGAILFGRRGMRRAPFEIAPMPGDCDYLPADLRQSTPAWGRRSRFEIDGHPLMVSEVFLAAFSPWPSMLPLHRSRRGR
jgi:chorismate--pyruvate lyase